MLLHVEIPVVVRPAAAEAIIRQRVVIDYRATVPTVICHRRDEHPVKLLTHIVKALVVERRCGAKLLARLRPIAAIDDAGSIVPLRAVAKISREAA